MIPRIPYTMAKFVVYEKVAETVYKSLFDKNTASDGTKTAVNLGSGLIAGFAAAIISQPADTMLSKINKTKGLPGESTTSRLIKIAKELGIRGSFTGIGARLVMIGTLTSGQFSIYGGMPFFLPSTFQDYFADLSQTSSAFSELPVVLRLPSRWNQRD